MNESNIKWLRKWFDGKNVEGINIIKQMKRIYKIKCGKVK